MWENKVLSKVLSQFTQSIGEDRDWKCGVGCCLKFEEEKKTVFHKKYFYYRNCPNRCILNNILGVINPRSFALSFALLSWELKLHWDRLTFTQILWGFSLGFWMCWSHLTQYLKDIFDRWIRCELFIVLLWSWVLFHRCCKTS